MHQRLSLMFGATKEIETEALFDATKDIESEQLIYSPNNGNIGRIELQLNLLLPCKKSAFRIFPICGKHATRHFFPVLLQEVFLPSWSKKWATNFWL